MWCFSMLTRWQCSKDATFIRIGKPKNKFELLYCNICLIVGVWNRMCAISEVCLYSKKYPGIHRYHSLDQEPKNSQAEWKKATDRHQHWDNRHVRIIWQRFWSAYHKNAPAKNYKDAWNHRKNRKSTAKKSHPRNRRHKERPRENLRTQKHNIQ